MDSKIRDALHGQHLKVILEEDSQYYYDGRCEVDTWIDNNSTGTVVVTIDAYPYKLKLEPTVVTVEVSSSEVITLVNMRKSVSPKIYTNSELKIGFENNVYILSPGIHIFPDLVLKEGNNVMELTGTAYVTFTYQEGGL